MQSPGVRVRTRHPTCRPRACHAEAHATPKATRQDEDEARRTLLATANDTRRLYSDGIDDFETKGVVPRTKQLLLQNQNLDGLTVRVAPS